jgi:serine/threonine protein kinase
MSTHEPPTSFGQYTLVRRLATGGMAEVFLAKVCGDSGFEKLVVIKRAHRLLGHHASALGLGDEAKLCVALTHPNIVQTFNFGREDGADFIVMEYVEGFDVQQVLDALAREGLSLPVDLAAFVVAEVCRGLDHAHRHRDADGSPAGIVHRDVSPQNVLLSLHGEVKVTDFGIAKTKARRSDPDGRVIKGKYFYMSPEQARAEPLDLRSDVFSAGVLLWELITGQRLHSAPDVPTLLARVQRAEVPPPSSLRGDSPGALDAIVARATAVRPEDRYPSAAAMAGALDAFVEVYGHVASDKRLASLLAQIPEPGPSTPVELVRLPRTRGRHGMMPRAVPVRYDLEDGRPTLTDWQRLAPCRDLTLWWTAAGAATVMLGIVAWLLHGS